MKIISTDIFFFLGLVKGNLSGTIGGGVVLGVSVLLSIILVLVFVYCLKNNDVNSNVNQQRTSPHQRQRKPNRQYQGNREQTSSHEITVISGTHNYNNHSRQLQQHTSNEYNAKAYSQPNQTMGLADSTNSTNGQQLPLSPAKNSSFWLNQSNGSMISPSQQSISNANMRRDNYNRH